MSRRAKTSRGKMLSPAEQFWRFALLFGLPLLFCIVILTYIGKFISWIYTSIASIDVEVPTFHTSMNKLWILLLILAAIALLFPKVRTRLKGMFNTKVIAWIVAFAIMWFMVTRLHWWDNLFSKGSTTSSSNSSASCNRLSRNVDLTFEKGVGYEYERTADDYFNPQEPGTYILRYYEKNTPSSSWERKIVKATDGSIARDYVPGTNHDKKNGGIHVVTCTNTTMQLQYQDHP